MRSPGRTNAPSPGILRIGSIALRSVPMVAPSHQGVWMTTPSVSGMRSQARTNGHPHRAFGVWVWSVAFSPDGRTLASGSLDDTIRLWDAVTGAHQRTLTGHTSSMSYSVAFSPDGRTLASGSGDWSDDDNTIRLWDAVTGAPQRTLTGHTSSSVYQRRVQSRWSHPRIGE